MKDFYLADRTGLSFELFPPKTQKGTSNLFDHLENLAVFQPDYITCTYGAGGSTQKKTLDVIKRVKSEFKVPVASHLTVVGSTVDELRAYLHEAQSGGIDYIVALRGDPPQGETEFTPVQGGLSYANQLVELVRDEFPGFGIAVAGYPEKHREAISMEVDLDHLKRKVDTGADVIITQLFYDNQDYFNFVELCLDRGIEIPIVPGILPVVNLSQVTRITSLCDAKLPREFVDRLQNAGSEQDQLEVGIEFATRQVEELLSQKVCGLHFYVLNKSGSTSKVLQSLNFQK
ncbi:MAG: methylenetetrahydrofolate reductase [NAD(P)H] [Planctomycetota bacterium]|nr:methylenetetrahydrofolate reductase [NAD(P)H] [Planctomycetota bacterium]